MSLVLQLLWKQRFISLFIFSSRAPFSLLEWEREKESLPESRLTFEVTVAQTSGLVNLVFSRQTGFIECEHPLIDKPKVTTEPAVARARMLGLGSKRYLSTLVQRLRSPWPAVARFVKPACAVRDADSRYEIDIIATCFACSTNIILDSYRVFLEDAKMEQGKERL